MGFFDRLLKQDSQNADNTIKPRKPAKEKPAEFFLDADSSSSLGNVDYMREAKTIRRTFPGTVNSPGTKEQIMTIAAETESLDKRSEGLGDAKQVDDSVNLTDGIPKPVKKTFAETMTQEQLDQKLKGNALRTAGVNTPMAPDAAPIARKEELKPEPEAQPASPTSQANSEKAGSIDPFKAMVRDLNK